MCVAILNTKGTTLKKEILKNCWLNNGDGAGMLYSDDRGNMLIHKEMKDFESFYEKYIDVKRTHGKKRNVVLHFRISTHGKVNLDNCHPFLVDDNLGFVHNGMIYDVPTSKDYSDTYMFNEHILKKLKPGFEYDEVMLEMIELYIGAGSKLIFLNARDEWAIVNERAGHWNMGCWFSNSSYKQVNDWVDFGGTKKYKTQSNYPISNYASYGWTPKNDDFKDWETPTQSMCEDCHTPLYGENELTRGICNDCNESSYLVDTEDICECCGNDFGTYNTEFRAYICKECTDFVYQEEGDSSEEMGA
jgi:hypothetical protein